MSTSPNVKIYHPLVVRIAERAAREASERLKRPIGAAPVLKVRVHQAPQGASVVKLRFEAAATAEVDITPDPAGGLFAAQVILRYRPEEPLVFYRGALGGWVRHVEGAAFCDSHGAVWQICDAGDPGAEAFGPRGAARRLEGVTHPEMVAAGYATWTDEAGWLHYGSDDDE